MRTSLKEHSPHLVDERSASIKNRVNSAGCPYCSNNSVLKGFNDLATLYPKQITPSRF